MVIDPRLKLLSYSSNLLLHECPRKFELYKRSAVVELKSIEVEESEELTFDFGKAVGYGVQQILLGTQLKEIIFNLFIGGWTQDILSVDEKRKKSFAFAIIALQKFQHLRNSGFLAGFEVASFHGKPAIELAFRINLPDGFKYRGFVDVVLINRTTGAIVVVEVKTSSGNLIHASFRNSAQAISYSVVLDYIAPDVSSYQVLYLVYKTKDMEFEPIPYPKSYLQRALWLNELLTDKDNVSRYAENVFPMHGENCINRYYKECKYLGVCTLSTKRLTNVLSDEQIEKLNKEEDEKFGEIDVSFEQLVETQLKKIELIESKLEQQQQSPVITKFEGDKLL
jgi:Holliday junction resolvase-like predicted endonuclease